MCLMVSSHVWVSVWQTPSAEWCEDDAERTAAVVTCVDETCFPTLRSNCRLMKSLLSHHFTAERSTNRLFYNTTSRTGKEKFKCVSHFESQDETYTLWSRIHFLTRETKQAEKTGSLYYITMKKKLTVLAIFKSELQTQIYSHPCWLFISFSFNFFIYRKLIMWRFFYGNKSSDWRLHSHWMKVFLLNCALFSDPVTFIMVEHSQSLKWQPPWWTELTEDDDSARCDQNYQPEHDTHQSHGHAAALLLL